MRTLQEIQQDFLQVQAEIGALELKKLGLFNKAVTLEAEFVKAKELADAIEAAKVKTEETKAE
jgi:hypothetical protein